MPPGAPVMPPAAPVMPPGGPDIPGIAPPAPLPPAPAPPGDEEDGAGEDEGAGEPAEAAVPDDEGAFAVLEEPPPQPAIPINRAATAPHKMSRRMQHLRPLGPGLIRRSIERKKDAK
jgi:hypothetical protein